MADVDMDVFLQLDNADLVVDVPRLDCDNDLHMDLCLPSTAPTTAALFSFYLGDAVACAANIPALIPSVQPSLSHMDRTVAPVDVTACATRKKPKLSMVATQLLQHPHRSIQDKNDSFVSVFAPPETTTLRKTKELSTRCTRAAAIFTASNSTTADIDSTITTTITIDKHRWNSRDSSSIEVSDGGEDNEQDTADNDDSDSVCRISSSVRPRSASSNSLSLDGDTVTTPTRSTGTARRRAASTTTSMDCCSPESAAESDCEFHPSLFPLKHSNTDPFTLDEMSMTLSAKERRQLRNKISARNFRQRKKQYMEMLEGQVRVLKNELSNEKRERVRKEEEVVHYRALVDDLTKQLIAWKGFDNSDTVATTAVSGEDHLQDLATTPLLSSSPSLSALPLTTAVAQSTLATSVLHIKQEADAMLHPDRTVNPSNMLLSNCAFMSPHRHHHQQDPTLFSSLRNGRDVSIRVHMMTMPDDPPLDLQTNHTGSTWLTHSTSVDDSSHDTIVHDDHRRWTDDMIDYLLSTPVAV